MSGYKRTTNPFEEDDDPDGFGGSSHRANHQSDSFDQEDRRERMMRQINESEDRQLDSLNRALSNIYESESVGVATAEELVRQGETLNNIETKTDTINRTLTTSQKHINNVKSVFGGIKNWWAGNKDNSGLPPSKSEPPASPLKSKLESHKDSQMAGRPRRMDTQGFLDDDEDIDSRFMAGARTSGQQQNNIQRITNSAREDEIDENLGLMSDGMSRLKMLASSLGDEIERQNDQLDRVNAKTDRALPRIENQNKQMRKILNK